MNCDDTAFDRGRIGDHKLPAVVSDFRENVLLYESEYCIVLTRREDS